MNKKKTFAASLKAAREARGWSKRKCGSVISKSRRTIFRWENGIWTPDEATQKGVLALVRGRNPAPSISEIKSAERSHHISWEKGRGWFMRITISFDPKKVGKRIKVRLKTRDIEDAIKRRDVVLSSYKVFGFKVSKTGALEMKS